MIVNTLFSVLNFSENRPRMAIDAITISKNGWEKLWRTNAISDMLSETGDMYIHDVCIFRNDAENQNVLAIEVI